MEDFKKSIVESLNGFDVELYPFLPYILQDLWEFGTDSSIIVALIKDNIRGNNLRILDLGCGKGAVSVHIAEEIECTVKGIDAMPDFIESAKNYAKQFNVQDKCDFETGDIRVRIKELKDFDVIVLGAIGSVFGDLYNTLRIITESIKPSGYVLLDDGYLPEELLTNYNRCLRQNSFYNQITTAGFDIIQEVIFEKEFIEESDSCIYDSIKKRINELRIKYPNKKEIFDEYLKGGVNNFV
jgi:SAM-dependent methyltransferase